jgi:hypothetical protein
LFVCFAQKQNALHVRAFKQLQFFVSSSYDLEKSVDQLQFQQSWFDQLTLSQINNKQNVIQLICHVF